MKKQLQRSICTINIVDFFYFICFCKIIFLLREQWQIMIDHVLPNPRTRFRTALTPMSRYLFFSRLVVSFSNTASVFGNFLVVTTPKVHLLILGRSTNSDVFPLKQILASSHLVSFSLSSNCSAWKLNCV